jgi:hypothetical protein
MIYLYETLKLIVVDITMRSVTSATDLFRRMLTASSEMLFVVAETKNL